MLRIALSQATRLCEPLVLEALAIQHAGLPRNAAALTLVTLRRFSTEESSASATSQPAAAAGGAPPKGVQQWRQWVDAKIGEKLDGKAEEKAEDKPAPAAAAEAAPQVPLAAAVAEPEDFRRAVLEEELRDLLRPEPARRLRVTAEEAIFKIVVPPREPGEGVDGRTSYRLLGQAKEAPRLFPGGSNKADEVSPDRVHPYRLFYPGQLYAPQDLDPYQAREAPFGADQGKARKFISRAEVEAKADFRNAQFLTSFVTDAGKLVPRRRTRLQQKLHRHLCRQVKIARIMAILPPDSRLPQFQPRRRAPRGPSPMAAAAQAAAQSGPME